MKRVKQCDEIAYVRRQYRTQKNLDVRIRVHELYSEPKVDFQSWVLDHVPWQGDETVLDVGCGSGSYAEPVRQRAAHYVAGDLSLGMLQGLPWPGPARVNLDAQRLPLASAVADAVLANHMLYHVPDQEAALAEFARVLRPHGRLLAVTNSAHNMPELRTLCLQAEKTLGLKQSLEVRPQLSFTLENGAGLLRRHFAHVERHDLPAALVFPEPQPVIDYVGTIRERLEELLPAGITWHDVAATLDELLQQHIAARGAFRVGKLTGVFVCWHYA